MPDHLVMDNYATHKSDKVKAWLAAHPRYQVHFTPTSASWLNLMERFFSTLSEKRIKRRAHTSVKDQEESIEYYLSTLNANPRPFRWHRNADDILASVSLAAATHGIDRMVDWANTSRGGHQFDMVDLIARTDNHNSCS